MTVDTTAWRLLGTYVDAMPDCGSPRGAAFGYSLGDRNPGRLQANVSEPGEIDLQRCAGPGQDRDAPTPRRGFALDFDSFEAFLLRPLVAGNARSSANWSWRAGNGFLRTSVAPASRARSITAALRYPLTSRIGRVGLSARILPTSSEPDIPGMLSSVMTALNCSGSARNASIAFVLEVKPTAEYPSSVSVSVASRTSASSSSMTMIWPCPFRRALRSSRFLGLLDMVTSPDCGTYTLNTLPLPTVVETSTAPPSPLTMPCTSERPRPVPTPTSLVVKNGSKILSKISAGMPVPESDTSMTTYSRAAMEPIVTTRGAWKRIRSRDTRSVPPEGIACTAFVSRFMRT